MDPEQKRMEMHWDESLYLHDSPEARLLFMIIINAAEDAIYPPIIISPNGTWHQKRAVAYDWLFSDDSGDSDNPTCMFYANLIFEEPEHSIKCIREYVEGQRPIALKNFEIKKRKRSNIMSVQNIFRSR